MRIKVLQFGEGNFLRAFADYYFDILNEKTDVSYSVTVVQPIPTGRAAQLKSAGLAYHVLLRSDRSQSLRKITCIADSINPFDNFDAYRAASLDPELCIIVSNTTEAGIAFDKKDKFDEELENTYPAKLTKLLYSRFVHFAGSASAGMYILPCELIEDNAAVLLSCVERYIELWGLSDEFLRWVGESCYFCSTLVDRIVPGFPPDYESAWKLIGDRDDFLVAAEPFGLWVVENEGDISGIMPGVESTVELVYTDDISYYKKRKVRVLNGVHTSLVPVALAFGLDTVSESLSDDGIFAFIGSLLDDEIVPYVDSDIQKTMEYASSVLGRFRNPYLNHRLLSISLNAVSKWRARVLPTLKDYYAANGRLPGSIMLSFGYMMAMYAGLRRMPDGFVADFGGKCLPINDEPAVLEHFSDPGLTAERKISAAIGADGFFGEDLTRFSGFESETLRLAAIVIAGGRPLKN